MTKPSASKSGARLVDMTEVRRIDTRIAYDVLTEARSRMNFRSAQISQRRSREAATFRTVSREEFIEIRTAGFVIVPLLGD